MNPKRISQRERALTIYFASEFDKRAFVKRAAGYGMSTSTLGSLMIYKAIEDGFFTRLDAAISDEQGARVIKSKRSGLPITKPERPKRPPPKTAKTKRSKGVSVSKEAHGK